MTLSLGYCFSSISLRFKPLGVSNGAYDRIPYALSLTMETICSSRLRSIMCITHLRESCGLVSWMSTNPIEKYCSIASPTKIKGPLSLASVYLATYIPKMQRNSPPYRAEHIGSLNRPAELIQKRAEYASGACPPEVLQKVEDEAIRRVIELQRSAGMKTLTDGEFRRYVI